MPKLDALETLYIFPVVATVASLLRLFRVGFLVRPRVAGQRRPSRGTDQNEA